MRALIAVAGCVALLGVSACDPRTEDNPHRLIFCQVIADTPEHDDDSESIVATARFWCDKPGADELTLTVVLQEEDDGEFVDIAAEEFTLSGEETIRTEEERYRTRSVFVPCEKGTFRTLVSGASVARGREASYDQTGARTVDPCRRPFD